MGNRAYRAAAAAICLAAVSSMAIAEGAHSQNGGTSSTVLVASTEASAEITQAVRIARRPRGEVAASLRPEDLPDLRTGDQFEVSAEVEVTTDCLRRHRHDKSGCRGKAYRYNPRIGARLVLTDGAGEVEGVPLSARAEDTCRQKLPAREHHCYIALTPDPVVVDEQALGCVPGTCRVNLVVDATHRKARRGNVVLLGGNKGDKKVKQDKASIDVIRTRPANPTGGPPEPPVGTVLALTGDRVTTSVSLGTPPRTAVVYSQALEDVRDGDQIAARGRLVTGIRRLRHNVNIASRIILTDSPVSTFPLLGEGDLPRERGEITESNGFNCTQRTTPCVTVKAGVLRFQGEAPGRLYVNLVLAIGRVGGRAPGDRGVTIADGGFLQVTHYPAAHRG